MSDFRSLGKDRQRGRADDQRILPLINIIFLLLIFFMLAGQFSAFEPFPVEPPRSATRQPPETQETTILMDPGGRLALDGVLVDAETLKRSIADRLAAGDTLEVRFKADGMADATHVVAVMELLRDAGLDRLDLLTLPGGG